MTVTYGALGTGATSQTTSIAPTIPAGVVTNTLMIMMVGMKSTAYPSTAAATTPAGWTAVGSFKDFGGYTATPTAGTGNANLFVFMRVATGSESGTVAVTLAGNSAAWAYITSYTRSLANWRVNMATGAQTTAATGWSVAATPGVGGLSGDKILGVLVNAVSATTWTVGSLTASGLTTGTGVELVEPKNANGFQIGGVIDQWSPSTGSTIAAPTITGTASTATNSRGGAAVIRISDYTITPTTLRATDTFTGTNGAAWPSGWSSTGDPAGGSTTIQGNEGEIVTGTEASGAYTAQNQKYLTSIQTEDIVFKFRIRYPTNQEIYPQFYLRSPNNLMDGSGGYYAEVANIGSHFNINLGWNYSGGSVPGTSDTSYPFVTGTQFYWVVFGVVGNNVKMKVWTDGSAEPGTWAYDVQDYSLGGAGYAGLRAGPGGTGVVNFHIDDFTVYNYFPAAPILADSAPVLTVGGTATAFRTSITDSTAPLTIAATSTATRAAVVDSTGGLTIAASAAMSATYVANAVAGLTISGSATASINLGATASAPLTIAGAATATRTARFDSAPVLTIAGVATATRNAVFASTAPLTIAGTATALRNAVLASTAPLTIGATSTAFLSRSVDSSVALTLAVTATGAVAKGFDSVAPISISAVASMGIPRVVDSVAPLTIAATASASGTRFAAATQVTTITGSADATRTGVLNAVAAIGLSVSSTINVTRAVDSTAPLTIAATAAATTTRPMAGTAPLTIAGVATAFNTTNVIGTSAFTLTTIAAASISGQTEALASLTLATTGSMTRIVREDALAPLSLGLVGTLSATHPLDGSGVLTVGGSASAAVLHPFSGVVSLVLSATASATVLHSAAVAGDGPLVLTATATGANSTTVQTTAPVLVLSTSATAFGKRPLASTAVTTVSVTAAASVTRPMDGSPVLTLTSGASALVNRKATAMAANLVMATTAVLNVKLTNGGQTDLELDVVAAMTVTTPSPIDQGDEFLLSVQRDLTHAYIMESPSTVNLRPRVRVRTSTGGFEYEPGAPRTSQLMRFIESSSIVNAGAVLKTETGFQRQVPYQLMGEWDATIEVDDTFEYGDRHWIVKSFMPYDGYQVRAVVDRYGE